MYQSDLQEAEFGVSQCNHARRVNLLCPADENSARGVRRIGVLVVEATAEACMPVSYTHLTLPTKA